MLGTPIFVIKQKLKGFKLVNRLICVGLVIIGMAILLEAIINYGFNINDTENMAYIIFGFGSFILGFIGFVVLHILSKKILVFKNHIKIGRKIIAVKEIKGVKFTGLLPSSILFRELEGMHIKCFDGKSFYLHDELYKNLYILKQFLNDEFTHEDNSEKELNSGKPSYLSQNFTPKIYKDSISFSLLIGLIIACLCLIISFILPKFDLTLGLILLFMFLATLYIRASLFYKFTISNQHIQLSPKYRLKKATTIPLKQIREIAAYEHSTQEDVSGILIITHDFKSYRIPLTGHSDKSIIRIIHNLCKLQLPLRKDFRKVL